MMQDILHKLDGVVSVVPEVYRDGRGYFMETFREDSLESHLPIPFSPVQDNESRSIRGVLRGLHAQVSPHAQSKLIRVVLGEILDVAIDIRQGSPTFGQHVAVMLSGENKQQLFVPRGFLHGFVVLSDEAIVCYKVDNYYAPEAEFGVSALDPTLGIDWRLPEEALIMSEKDANLPSLRDIASPFRYQHRD